MSAALIERLYQDNKLLLERLSAANEISLATTVEDVFRKTLLLAVASYFEHQISGAILLYVSERSNSDAAVVNLTKVKAVDRQYHTYFDWNGPNANSFFGHFGEKYKEYAREQVQKQPGLKDGVQAFLEIGSLRNQLVHQNFATFALDKTADEIYQLYQRAVVFVEFIPISLRHKAID